MAGLPHDMTDLRLAPVALAFDAAIEELGRLPLEKLAWQVESHRDVPETTADDRRGWLLAQIESRVKKGEWDSPSATAGSA